MGTLLRLLHCLLSMHLFSSGLSNFQRNKYSLVQLHSLHPSPFSGFPTIVLGRVGSVLVYLSEWLIRFNFVCSLPYCPFLLWLITLLQSPNKWSRYLVFIFGSFPQPKCIEPLHRQQFRNSWPGFLPLTAALDMARWPVDWYPGWHHASSKVVRLFESGISTGQW